MIRPLVGPHTDDVQLFVINKTVIVISLNRIVVSR
jgi:hypothetical protein